jgi:hypothetical protein
MIFQYNAAVLLAVVVGSVSLFNACGNEKSEKEKVGEPVAPPQSQPGSSEANPTEPNPKPPAISSEANTSATPKVANPEAVPLFPLIEVGEYKETTAEQKFGLITTEALRCRLDGQEILHPDSEREEPQVDSLEATYRKKHLYPNPFDPCRKTLMLTGNFGYDMKLEDLVQLETCTRIKAIDSGIPSPSARNEARLQLLLEQLTMLCQLKQSQLSPVVQKALGSSFVFTWDSLE